MRVLLLFTLSLPVAAETLTLDFATAAKSLAANNRDILAARKNMQTAQYNYRGAYAGFLPQVTAGVNYTQGNSATTAQLAGQSATYQLYSASLGVSQSVFSGLSDYYKVKGARANAELSEANFALTAAKALYELKASWSLLSLAKRQYELALETQKRRQDNMKMIELRFNSGSENKGSLLLAQSYRAQADRDVNQSLRQRTNSETELKRVLNLPQDSEIQISGNTEVRLPPENFALGDAARKTPEYRQASAQELSAEATADASISPFFPTVTASGSLFRQGPDFFPQGDRWSVNVGVSYPLFSGGKDYYALKANNSAFEAAKRNRESIETQRISKLQQALQGFRAAVENAKVSESLLSASMVRAQIARVKYMSGLLSFDQWDIIENELISRQKDVLQTRYDLEIAQAVWEQALGEGPAN
ncbi:MAG: TolC family protein [Spirochaetes bacterium]|nr:TolC family protein [Spirochaetota bacterium]